MKRRSFVKGIGALFALAAIPAIAVADKVKRLPLFKTVFVNSIHDLPKSQDGTIHLEANTEYVFTNSVSTDNKITLGNNSIINGKGVGL